MSYPVSTTAGVAADRTRAEAAQSHAAATDVVARLSSLVATLATTGTNPHDTLDAVAQSMRTTLDGSKAPSAATVAPGSVKGAVEPRKVEAQTSLKHVTSAYAEQTSAQAA